MIEKERVLYVEDCLKKIGVYIAVTFVVAVDGQTRCVVMSEHLDNSAMSITNNVENVATEVMKASEIRNPGRFIWIEHYPIRISRDSEETFDLVTFDWLLLHPEGPGSIAKWTARRPSWTFSSRDWVEKLIGMKYESDNISRWMDVQ